MSVLIYTDAAGWLTGWLLLLKYERVTRGAKKRTIIFRFPVKRQQQQHSIQQLKDETADIYPQNPKPQCITITTTTKEGDDCLPACWSMSGSTSWWQLWAGNTGGGWNITNTCHVVRSYHTLTLNPLQFTSRHDTLKIQSLLSGANNDRRHQWKQFWRNEKTLNYNDLVLLFLLHNGLKWR